MALKDFDIIEDLKPIGGGWRYMQPVAEGKFVRIPTQGGSPTARRLVEQVKAYRNNQGILVGNPERDIAEYIGKVSPQNDRFRGKGGVLGQPRIEPFVPLIQRIREWVDKLAPQKPDLVDLTEASERAVGCIGCSQNIRWKTNCGECNEAVDYLGFAMRGRPSFDLDDALHGCRLHALHLPSAVFIDRDHLPAKLGTEPPACWLPTKPTP